MKRIAIAFLSILFAILGLYGFNSPPVKAPVTASLEAPDKAAAQKAAFIISEKRRQHILVGDETGGGHRAGAGRRGKSEFPRHWDDAKIISTALQIANDEQIPMRPSGRYWLKMKEVEGIKIRVVLNRENGEVITAYPLYPKDRR